MNTILVIEDDRLTSEAYETKLKNRGFEVFSAHNYSEAEPILKDKSIDLIVLDLLLPEKDGFTILETLKKTDSWKDIPVLVSSNLDEMFSIKHAMDMGASDYVVKSDTSLDALVKKIHDLI